MALEWITMLGGVLDDVLAIAADATPGQVGNILKMVEKFVGLAVGTAPALLEPLQNILYTIEGGHELTAVQLAQLTIMSDQVDAALDAAAEKDGLV